MQPRRALTQATASRYTDATGKCNFDPGSCTYQILVGSADHTIHLPFRDVLRTLVPVGTVLGLKMDSPAGEQLLGQLPSRWATCDLIQVCPCWLPAFPAAACNASNLADGEGRCGSTCRPWPTPSPARRT